VDCDLTYDPDWIMKMSERESDKDWKHNGESPISIRGMVIELVLLRTCTFHWILHRGRI